MYAVWWLHLSLTLKPIRRLSFEHFAESFGEHRCRAFRLPRGGSVVKRRHCAHIPKDLPQKVMIGRRPSLREVVLQVLLVYATVSANGDDDASQQSIIGNVIPTCIFGVDNVDVFLYTRDLREGKLFSIDDIHVPINPDGNVFILVHGFISEANNTNFVELANKLIKTYENSTVLSVDWRQGACSGGITLADLIAYPNAIRNTKDVGYLLARYVRRLRQRDGADLDRVVCIGHSLGAHICGYFGSFIQRMKDGGIIGSIFGLDPAGPGFEHGNWTNKLSYQDARYVQAIHTSALLGIHESIAHVDLYINGQLTQPQCLLPTCSHTRAVVYFVESVMPNCTFVGTPWTPGTLNLFPPSRCTAEKCTILGLKSINFPARGTFYVTTGLTEPYCSKDFGGFL